MESEGRGALLYAYRPIPANPMAVALLLLVLVVTFGIGPLVAGLDGLSPLGGIRDRFARRHERMITTAKSYSDTEVLSMQNQARQPLVRIEGVFTAFFLPPSIVAVLLITLQWLHVGLTAVILLVVLFFALLPPAVSMARTLRQSERRNETLSELAKFQEHLRERSEVATDGAKPQP